ncbi:phage replisome organizer N-terminal domain-containing protein [Clostridium thailandense]|uniref:phage replisome organizer N-terminal domain-containing protein n=1 Tax=Clostridium thailandense TaxID=2794346 RepID=UPI0039899744
MAEVKWIKIVTDIFDDEKILLIESMPEADAIIVIWFKLLCLAGKNNNKGVFILNDTIAYTDEMLGTIFRRSLNTVRLALKVFQRYGMIEIINGVVTIPNWSKHQTLDQIDAKREYQRQYMARKRKEQKLLAKCESNSKSNSESNSEDNRETNVRTIEVEEEIEEEIDNTTATTKKDKNYMEFFSENFYIITPFENEILKSYESNGINPEVITLALKQAIENNKKNIGYVKKILDRFLKENLFTIEAVISDKEKFEKNKKGIKSYKKQDKISTFNNYKQRDYSSSDLKRLEEQLLGWRK